jgi:cell division protein FtsQ
MSRLTPRATRRKPALQDRPGRWQLLLRRQRRRLRPVLFGLAGAALIVLAGAAAWRAVAPGPQASLVPFGERLGLAGAALGLRIRHVEIEGRAQTPEPLLRAALGALPGQPILGFSLAAARARIETLSWVRNAAVERRLPDTIVVRLVERRAFAIWQNQGKFTLIDRQGAMVADQDVAQFRQLPLVVGAGAPAHAAALLDALASVPAIAGQVVAMVRVGERRWTLHLRNGCDVLLPEGHAAAALQRLAALQQTHALLERPLQTIDMRLPDRLLLRPRTAEPAPSPLAARSPT